MDQPVTDGKKKRKPRRGPERQVFVGGYIPEDLARRFQALANFYGVKKKNALLVRVIEDAVRLGPPAKETKEKETTDA